ncbi:MAG TPA: hypothetical protein VGF28_22575 [Thermoanaerobaculia bacterium]|jgi:hypothetical protein
MLLSLPAFAFNIVTTSAPEVNDVFTNDGVAVCDWDRAEELFDGGWLISRVYEGEVGSPAEGKWVYEYRVDMTDATDPASIPEIESVDIFNGPMLQYDYNFDSTSTDDIYVITSGGLGSIGLASVTTLLTGDRRFLFSSYVAGGGGTGLGQSSYHFGFISDDSPHAILATVNTVAGPLSVPVWAPSY